MAYHRLPKAEETEAIQAFMEEYRQNPLPGTTPTPLPAGPLSTEGIQVLSACMHTEPKDPLYGHATGFATDGENFFQFRFRLKGRGLQAFSRLEAVISGRIPDAPWVREAENRPYGQEAWWIHAPTGTLSGDSLRLRLFMEHLETYGWPEMGA